MSNAGRARMLEALREEGLAQFIVALAGRYGLSASAVDWAETPEPVGHNNSRFAAYQVPIAGADGKLAILGSAWFSLPGSYSNALSCIADLRISFEAIRPAPAPGHARPAQIQPELRVAPGELTRFLTRAWHVTTMIPPAGNWRSGRASARGSPEAGAVHPERASRDKRSRPHGSDTRHGGSNSVRAAPAAPPE